MPISSERSGARAPSDEELLFRYLNEIGIIHQLSSTAFQRVLPYGLTGAQFTVLNRGTLTSTLARLAAKKFIRLVPDAIDGRSKRVLLTAAGRRAREQSIKASWPLLEQVKTVLSPRAAAQQLPTLEALREWLDRNR